MVDAVLVPICAGSSRPGVDGVCAVVGDFQKRLEVLRDATHRDAVAQPAVGVVAALLARGCARGGARPAGGVTGGDRGLGRPEKRCGKRSGGADPHQTTPGLLTPTTYDVSHSGATRPRAATVNYPPTAMIATAVPLMSVRFSHPGGANGSRKGVVTLTSTESPSALTA